MTEEWAGLTRSVHSIATRGRVRAAGRSATAKSGRAFWWLKSYHPISHCPIRDERSLLFCSLSESRDEENVPLAIQTVANFLPVIDLKFSFTHSTCQARLSAEIFANVSKHTTCKCIPRTKCIRIFCSYRRGYRLQTILTSCTLELFTVRTEIRLSQTKQATLARKNLTQKRELRSAQYLR